MNRNPNMVHPWSEKTSLMILFYTDFKKEQDTKYLWIQSCCLIAINDCNRDLTDQYSKCFSLTLLILLHKSLLLLLGMAVCNRNLYFSWKEIMPWRHYFALASLKKPVFVGYSLFSLIFCSSVVGTVLKWTESLINYKWKLLWSFKTGRPPCTLWPLCSIKGFFFFCVCKQLRGKSDQWR